MSSNIQITTAQLSRLVGLPDAPTIVDVRIPDDVALDPRILPLPIIARTRMSWTGLATMQAKASSWSASAARS